MIKPFEGSCPNIHSHITCLAQNPPHSQPGLHLWLLSAATRPPSQPCSRHPGLFCLQMCQGPSFPEASTLAYPLLLLTLCCHRSRQNSLGLTPFCNLALCSQWLQGSPPSPTSKTTASLPTESPSIPFSLMYFSAPHCLTLPVYLCFVYLLPPAHKLRSRRTDCHILFAVGSPAPTQFPAHSRGSAFAE